MLNRIKANNIAKISGTFATEGQGSGTYEILRFPLGFQILTGQVTLLSQSMSMEYCRFRLPIEYAFRSSLGIAQVNRNASQILYLDCGINIYPTGGKRIEVDIYASDLRDSNITVSLPVHFIAWGESDPL